MVPEKVPKQVRDDINSDDACNPPSLYSPTGPQTQPAREYLLRKYFTNSSILESINTHTNLQIHEFTNSLICTYVSIFLFEMSISYYTPYSLLHTLPQSPHLPIPPSLFLFPDDFNQHSLLPFPVKFPIEDLFPWAEIKLPFCDGYHHFTSHDGSFEVGISIILKGIMSVL
jgi:hypothetical protein